MAQWARQYTGNTHETRVDDAERALREAIAEQADPKDVLPDEVRLKWKKLAEKILFAREQVIRAKLSRSRHVPTEEAFENQKLAQDRMVKSLEVLYKGGVDAILLEFGV